MIVLDASALVELLLSTAAGKIIADRIENPGVALHTPHVADLEVTQVLRRRVREREIEGAEAAAAIATLQALAMQRHAHEPLLDRIWALRFNLSAYDASYVALAESLEALLLTCDERLARAPGPRTRIEFVPAARIQ